jgi:RHH-type proline utilization regulon transcriptional repressor/proline dehydrogenase/delta 1-pyrroline-5-carboxylate dehydrogenase
MIFTKPLPKPHPLREQILLAYRMDETLCIDYLLQEVSLNEDARERIDFTARELVTEVRKQRLHKNSLDAFLYQYDLSSEEGVALMCLAEALLRVPDRATIAQLIRDKISPADWQAQVGKSESFFVNAATWGLMLTGKMLNYQTLNEKNLSTALKKLLSHSSEPILRNAIRQSMKILGRQFVMGQTIESALKRAKNYEKIGYRFSYDMLGEAARTPQDAEQYFNAYLHAIQTVGKAAEGKEIHDAPGVSVKLSALHPRYEFSQRDRCLPFIIDRVRELALQAKHFNIGFTIDAEEADRLEPSLDIIQTLFTDPQLQDWQGFGMAVQAYQKRAVPLIDWLAELARQQRRRFMLRLVKGAYWDYEIKDSQVKGLSSYPVFTRKRNTDVSYLACVKKIASAQDAFYPQFATHNAHTVAAILEIMGTRRDFEFQCLHGMGYTLYDHIVPLEKKNIPCRVYAPVGGHDELLSYLVRRLLENGANTSFVNRIVDAQAPIKELVADPIEMVRHFSSKPHPHIPLPVNIFGAARQNSLGIDLTNVLELGNLAQEMNTAAKVSWEAAPTFSKTSRQREAISIVSPSNHMQVVGTVWEANTEDVTLALKEAHEATEAWDAVPVNERAAYLERAADLFEHHRAELMALLVLEGGKCLPDALGEVREATDYCRYYAQQAKEKLSTQILPGPTGENNQLQMHGRGIIACISPWNFPLAIFIGQVVAALVAGNTVIAKPAKQTPLVAAKAIQLLHKAGIPEAVVQLLPGKGSIVGQMLISDKRVKGIVFTGSTETARSINQTLANREGPIIPLIAETGGQNAMIVDSSALPEQVIGDVLISAFNSAGQRCSALRVLFVQEEIADRIIALLQGAMMELQMSDPSLLKTDIGPVIDQSAKEGLKNHIHYLDKVGRLIYQAPLPDACQHGTFFAPCAYEIPDLSVLQHEVFGPILHVIRYSRRHLDKVIDAVNNTGYGLTLGIHSRINETVRYIQERIHAGNTYVNRNMIGAVVGVQPFGGEELSGTGPKAGGPHYLPRFCNERTLTINTTATGGNPSLLTLSE